MTTVLYPFNASPDDIAAEDVVLPTPPLPEVTTIILAKAFPFHIRFIINFSLHAILKVIQHLYKGKNIIFFNLRLLTRAARIDSDNYPAM